MTPLDATYAVFARTRRRLLTRPGRQRRLARPVISVGNLAVGGSGKTPATAYLARLLVEAGEAPAILSRGYGRERPEDGITVVHDGRRLMADVERAGDEPFMLARALRGVRVLVGADRYLAGRLAETQLGATVHLLDDGFQHLTLARQLDLVLVEAEDVFQPRTLPGGRLREPLDAARAADALLVAGGGPDEVAVRLGVARAFALLRELDPAVEETSEGPAPLAVGTRVYAVCGIARPDRFLAQTRGAGFDLAGSLPFRDHYPFSADDVALIARRAAEARAEVVLVTEKDYVRLLRWRPWPFRLAVRPMRVRIEPAAVFASWVLERLRDIRAAGRGAAA